MQRESDLEFTSAHQLMCRPALDRAICGRPAITPTATGYRDSGALLNRVMAWWFAADMGMDMGGMGRSMAGTSPQRLFAGNSPSAA